MMFVVGGLFGQSVWQCLQQLSTDVASHQPGLKIDYSGRFRVYLFNRLLACLKLSSIAWNSYTVWINAVNHWKLNFNIDRMVINYYLAFIRISKTLCRLAWQPGNGKVIVLYIQITVFSGPSTLDWHLSRQLVKSQLIFADMPFSVHRFTRVGRCSPD